MDLEDIKNYWDKRAAIDTSAQSTTNDVFLREIEFSVINDVIARTTPKVILDVGCGDARTTIRLAKVNSGRTFEGLDYSVSMVNNARSLLSDLDMSNISVRIGDATKELGARDADLVYTTRCLINLPSWEMQLVALESIRRALADGGYYLMIENFEHGHNNFNELRRQFGLPEIPVRGHNLYLNRARVLSAIEERFKLVDEINISSTYYLVTRIVYAKLCDDEKSAPDYRDKHHEYASRLPFIGEYGPVRLMLLQKS